MYQHGCQPAADAAWDSYRPEYYTHMDTDVQKLCTHKEEFAKVVTETDNC